MSSSSNTTPLLPDISTSSLSYSFPNNAPGLADISLSLPSRSRTLLIGANGAGKTTLLRLLSGKRMAPAKAVTIAGLDPFKDSLPGVSYLGVEWVLNPIVRTDIEVPVLLDSVGGTAFPERRDELVKMLDIDLRWHMHAVSDGERRRVQLAMGLLQPWRVLLLDEITVDLDLLSRARFLRWLSGETERRDCTVVYATHILDNLADWPTHLVHMSLGRVKKWGTVEQMVQAVGAGGSNGGGEEEERARARGDSKLGLLVLRWLAEDLEERGPRNAGIGAEALEGKQIGGYGLEKRPEN